jgi:hypothetical protein
MDAIKTINVFYSSEDQKTFPSVGAVLLQLQLLEATWTTSQGDEIELKLHDTAAIEGFEVSPELVEQIVSNNETVLTLIAPNALLGRGMLTSAAWQQLLAAGKENKVFLLGVYCEKVCNADRMSPLLGGRNWFVTKLGLHLSSGDAINDEAADVGDKLIKVLEKRFYG